MGRRAELFVRELSDGEAAHLLKFARRSRNPTVQHRAMLLFASFQGQSLPQIALLHRASATRVAELMAHQGPRSTIRSPTVRHEASSAWRTPQNRSILQFVQGTTSR
jgi:hypothetical protein